jgi:hypothetical protein
VAADGAGLDEAFEVGHAIAGAVAYFHHGKGIPLGG